MKNSFPAPIALFVYNRLDHLKECIKSLKKNKLCKKSDLIIFSDGYKRDIQNKTEVERIRKYIKNLIGFKSIKIHEREKNLGLAKSIVKGLNYIFKNYSKVIVLEDDLVVSSKFLEFMNTNLQNYQENRKVISIHGYCYPINFQKKTERFFFLRGADCWGWATWKRGWKLYQNDANKLLESIKSNRLKKQFNFNNSYPYFEMLEHASKTNHSWAIKWYASAFIKNKLTLYPKLSYVRNIGNDGSGTNTKKLSDFFTKKMNENSKFPKIEVKESNENRIAFENFFRKIYKKPFIIKRILNLFNK